MSENENNDSELTAEEREKIKRLRADWKQRKHTSTLPAWKELQTLGIDLAKLGLQDIDEETKEWVVRELLITLRCHYCERRRNDTCNFPICVRGLLSGYDVKDSMLVKKSNNSSKD
jgi:hypothetical protein